MKPLFSYKVFSVSLYHFHCSNKNHNSENDTNEIPGIGSKSVKKRAFLKCIRLKGLYLKARGK